MKQDLSGRAREIMIEFAGLTGLLPHAKARRRYLWTDAFAVCNFLELYRLTRDGEYRRLALGLVEQVHYTLGRHRTDDTRTGWISGLDEEEGRKHPAAGGLRIGKDMKERMLFEPLDEKLEWDRDGQYYHYLTKWMHALNRVSLVTGDPVFNIRAIELAKTAHAAFTYLPSSERQKRMYWKMSIDLSYPLVKSMGHLDPLDGFITYSQLQSTVQAHAGTAGLPDLSAEIDDMIKICEGKDWTTDDPLGIGDLLCMAWKAAQLTGKGHFREPGIIEVLLDSSLSGLQSYFRTGPLELPADYRLPFRELGLAIGLRAFEMLRQFIEQAPELFGKKESLHELAEDLVRYEPIGDRIVLFWLEQARGSSRTWEAHRDINLVMLATAIAPDTYLTI